MLNIKQIQRRLNGYSCRYVSDLTGLSHNTVWKFKVGKIKYPAHDTVMALCHFIETEEGK